jgi:hypothetical protein
MASLFLTQFYNEIKISAAEFLVPFHSETNHYAAAEVGIGGRMPQPDQMEKQPYKSEATNKNL